MHSECGRWGWRCLPLMERVVNSTDKPRRQACQPSRPPQAVAQPPPRSFRGPCLMFSLSGICRDKVAPLYLPRRFPGEIDSGGIVQWQGTPSEPSKLECAILIVSLTPRFSGTRWCCPVKKIFLNLFLMCHWVTSQQIPYQAGRDRLCRVGVGGHRYLCNTSSTIHILHYQFLHPEVY